MLIVGLRYTFFLRCSLRDYYFKSSIVIFGTPKILLTVLAIISHVKTMRLRRRRFRGSQPFRPRGPHKKNVLSDPSFYALFEHQLKVEFKELI